MRYQAPQPNDSVQVSSADVGGKVSIPAVTSGFLRPGESDRRKVVLAEVNQVRELALDRLAKRLADTMMADINRSEREAISASDSAYKGDLEAGIGLGRLAFEVYARKRIRLVLDQQLLAGHPSRNDALVRDLGIGKLRNEKADALKKQIGALDAEYKRESERLVQEAWQGHQTAVDGILAEFRKKRETALADARRQAGVELKSELQVLEALQSSTKPITVNPSAGQTTAVSQGTAPVPDRMMPALRDASLEKAKIEIGIWAELHGVKVVFTDSRYPDRTQEFLEWRTKRDGHSNH